jgi:hypothetical protein
VASLTASAAKQTNAKGEKHQKEKRVENTRWQFARCTLRAFTSVVRKQRIASHQTQTRVRTQVYASCVVSLVTAQQQKVRQRIPSATPLCFLCVLAYVSPRPSLIQEGEGTEAQMQR